MHPYVIVDVFTDTALEGNALAVFTAGEGIPAERMQRVAREMNLSETVFVLPPKEGGDAWIRIFTPAVELPFAGHPTLGSAFVLCGQRGQDAIELETGAGVVRVEFAPGNGTPGRAGSAAPGGPGPGVLGPGGLGVVGEYVPGLPGRMRQPIPTWEPYERAAEVLAGLGVESSRLPVEAYVNGPRHVYVALDSEEAVAAVRPDLTALGLIPGIGVCCFAGAGPRWKLRNFVPALGVGEDPATGSAAGPLAVHLARHDQIAFGQQIEIRQGDEIGRPSILLARVEATTGQITNVEVAGSAVIVARGELLA
ncbi:MAG TPA: PhzF family phenazine biosynthesis protein [Streptosporangiaceae bacterium]|nr:PhzF family phenazine biosynthesis protein [Streptosporangiaceae bacterium]